MWPPLFTMQKNSHSAQAKCIIYCCPFPLSNIMPYPPSHMHTYFNPMDLVPLFVYIQSCNSSLFWLRITSLQTSMGLCPKTTSTQRQFHIIYEAVMHRSSQNNEEQGNCSCYISNYTSVEGIGRHGKKERKVYFLLKCTYPSKEKQNPAQCAGKEGQSFLLIVEIWL